MVRLETGEGRPMKEQENLPYFVSFLSPPRKEPHPTETDPVLVLAPDAMTAVTIARGITGYRAKRYEAEIVEWEVFRAKAEELLRDGYILPCHIIKYAGLENMIDSRE